MIVSLSWLREYVSVDLAPDAIAEALTMAGLEVEAIWDRFAFLESVRVGRIQAVTPHPNADRLRLCRVDIGERTLTVVCGAPNAAEGMLVPCALPGTRMPDGKTLRTGEIRGQDSQGMLCSEAELGLGMDRSGLMALTADLAVGQALNQALGLNDTVMEIGLTPNRSDCLSILGVAREIAAAVGTRIRYPEIELPRGTGGIEQMTSVTLCDPDLCPRYAARLVVDIAVGPSPFWLQDRLVSVGLKPISNVVDITNFVMMELGQPLHAFDFDRLEENRIVVRAAADGEPFTTLDEKPRTLEAGMCMICDGKKPVAVGGVMGGLNSEIADDTRRVLIESACFNPVSVRKTAKALGLATDASHRFERGADPHGTVNALNRAAQLMVAICGGTLVSGVIDAHPRPAEQKVISMSAATVNRRLGTDLSVADMARYLSSVEFSVDTIDADRLAVTPPSFRVDVSRWEDLSEEIARLYGYNNIAVSFPRMTAEAGGSVAALDLRHQIKTLMTGMGFSEVINYSFIHGDSADRLDLKAEDPRRKGVAIVNPISEDQAVMRPTLIAGMLQTAVHNLAMQNRNLRLFEIGHVFFDMDDPDSLPHEQERFAALWTGARAAGHWQQKEIPCDFYDLKGGIEALLERLGLERPTFTAIPADDCTMTRPGHSARLIAGGRELGWVGEVSSATRAAYDLKQEAFVFEIDMQALAESLPDTATARPVPRYPATSRDVTLIVADTVEAMGILDSAARNDHPLVERLHLLDVYAGEPIAQGKKSVTFRIVYRSAEQTLEDDTVNPVHQGITDRLIHEFNADLPT
ncbi:MAG: phenylalanine--tRNA ligase subunit beta [Desulfobacterales bacterium]|nr:phenylalanine--tRNA ligase subunit beta [Desulfobacterales bacterium]